MKPFFSFCLILFMGTCNSFGQTTYTFNGNGNWSDSANWVNRAVPPNELSAGSSIEISPQLHGQCILDIPQLVLNGGVLTVMSGAKFIMLSDLINYGDTFDDSHLTLEGVEHLDTCGAPAPTLEEMSVVDGIIGGKNYRELEGQNLNDDLIRNMLNYAWTLIIQKNTTDHSAGTSKNPDETLTEPFHKGFAYSYGTDKDLNSRHKPNRGDILHNSYSVFGTDCTGFLYNLLQHEGINIIKTDVSGFEAALKTAISNSKYKNLAVKKYGNLPIGLLKSGDFILWSTGKNNHDGIIKKLPNGKVDIFNSNGTDTPLTPGWAIRPDPKHVPPIIGVRRTFAKEQELNLGPKRGIHALDFEIATNERAGFWGTDYKILRLEETGITVETMPPSSISQNNAISGGNIISDGGYPIIANGVCWNTSPNPTISNSKISADIGIASFQNNITGLKCDQNYFVRAYVTNQKGTFYGQEEPFHTKKDSGFCNITWIWGLAPNGTSYYGIFSSYPSDPNSEQIFESQTLCAPDPQKIWVGIKFKLQKGENYTGQFSWQYSDLCDGTNQKFKYSPEVKFECKCE